MLIRTHYSCQYIYSVLTHLKMCLLAIYIVTILSTFLKKHTFLKLSLLLSPMAFVTSSIRPHDWALINHVLHKYKTSRIQALFLRVGGGGLKMNDIYAYLLLSYCRFVYTIHLSFKQVTVLQFPDLDRTNYVSVLMSHCR